MQGFLLYLNIESLLSELLRTACPSASCTSLQPCHLTPTLTPATIGSSLQSQNPHIASRYVSEVKEMRSSPLSLRDQALTSILPKCLQGQSICGCPRQGSRLGRRFIYDSSGVVEEMQGSTAEISALNPCSVLYWLFACCRRNVCVCPKFT